MVRSAIRVSSVECVSFEAAMNTLATAQGATKGLDVAECRWRWVDGEREGCGSEKAVLRSTLNWILAR